MSTRQGSGGGTPSAAAGNPVPDGWQRPRGEPEEDLGLDEMEEDSQTIDGLRNMEWWDGMEWDTLKRHTGVTMGAVPRSLKHAVAQWRVKVCRHINEADNEEAQTRGWKLLFAMDLLMFDDLRENAGDRTKSNMITDRMEYMEKGQWGSVWTLVGYRRQSDTDQRK